MKAASLARWRAWRTRVQIEETVNVLTYNMTYNMTCNMPCLRSECLIRVQRDALHLDQDLTPYICTADSLLKPHPPWPPSPPPSAASCAPHPI